MTKLGSIILVVLLTLATPQAEEVADKAAQRHLIYLHGRIVQVEQDPRPEHPEYGVYELQEILNAFQEHGFVVHGGIRPESATVTSAADQVVEEIRALLASGVPADRITVVGGSMGGAIALLTAIRLQNPQVRFCTLGTCLSSTVRYLANVEKRDPVGRILAIREASDELTEPCPPWEDGPEESSSLLVREIVVETGLRHGFLYRPLPEWMGPLLEWTDGGAR